MDYIYSDYDISQYARGLDSTSSAVLGTALGAFFGVYLVIVLAIGILQIVGMWKLYTKAGEKGWKSIIPIYNLVILFKIAGLSPWLILVYLAAIIPFIGFVAVVVLQAYLAYNLAKSFGKDGGWAVGLFFLPFIFYLMLAFGKAEYVGTTTEKVEVSKVEEEPKSDDN